ncbi:hypothetical protein F2Q69_00035643 [Brassica cretica]|uniref:Uncharacterized protein n=1 Tax=Brassica cretica TaxID=69181 RepID=A0A8S9SIQ4_BRACR|nr:hypothetical protein F2Q69_00035643 [Brassica cretica]
MFRLKKIAESIREVGKVMSLEQFPILRSRAGSRYGPKRVRISDKQPIFDPKGLEPNNWYDGLSHPREAINVKFPKIVTKKKEIWKSPLRDKSGPRRARETTGENPDLSTEVQNLKEKLDEHSKQLVQSAEKLSQLQSENTVLRDQNQALNATGNKKRRFDTQIRPTGNLNTPNSREGTTDTPPTSGVAGATREGTDNHQIDDLEESDSEPEPKKEAPEKAEATESSITAYLEHIFSKRFDAR